MSNQSFTRTIVKSILKNTKSRDTHSDGKSLTIGEAAKVLLESKEAQQCLVLTVDVLQDLTWGYNESVDEKIKGGQVAQYRKLLVAAIRAKSSTPVLDTPAGSHFKRLVESSGLSFGVNIFYVPGTFDNIKKIIRTHNEDFSKLKKRTYDHGQFNKSINIDHGGEGVASGLMGAAIGTEVLKQTAGRTAGYKTSKKFESILRKILDKGLNSVADKGTLLPVLLDLQMTSSQLVDKNGKLKAGMSMLLTPKRKKDNLLQAGGEGVVQRQYLSAYEQSIPADTYMNMEGSSTLKEKIEQAVFNSAIGAIKKTKSTRVVRKKKVANKTESKGKSSEKAGRSKKVKKLNASYTLTGSRKVTDKNTSAALSPFSYLAMINKKLPQTVRKNMKAPALENRSGRFASSVQVKDATTTKEGYPSFGYSYQKDPYQVFEVGQGAVPWSTSQRDPRRLIDKSIREVAAELAIGRFYTRRL